MRLHLTLATLTFACAATAAPVINEIYFRPPGIIEPVAQEWLELRNPDAVAVDVSGWALTKGVAFTIPAATVIPAGGYLVIAANVAAFNAAHVGFTGTVIGGWTGTLANGNQQVQLDDNLGSKVCDVTYADEGEWALRGRGVLSLSHKGWSWFNKATESGNSLELRNPALGIGSGQNWGFSATVGGSPGAANSVASTNVAPLIKDVKHRPIVPKTTDPIVVSCNLEDEAPITSATLHWRLDGGTFATLTMTDTNGDGDVEASIPAQANLAVVEWYISATDGVNTRTWPAPARTSDPGILPETFGQVTNALVQVDNTFDAAANFRTAGNQPIYRFVMTEVERAELAQIGSTSGQEHSDATMNGSFVSQDGTGVQNIYLCGFRNRGFSSALGPPNNFHVNFRSDDTWHGRKGFQINCQYGYSQALGNACFERAGVQPQETEIVKIRVNGADLAGTGAQMYSRYARLEGRGGSWTSAHFPNDPDGNFYRLDDHSPGTDGGVVGGNRGTGEFRYEGTDPAAYSDTFLKETNIELNDYSDLANFTKIVSAPATGGVAVQPAIADADYPAAVATVLDIDEFYRYFAVDALIGNQEGGMQSGRADDASLYRGVIDTRFKFLPHDMDDVFDIGSGSGNPLTRSIFSYDTTATAPGPGLVGLNRMFNHPQMAPRYYAAVLDAMDTWFNHATLDPLIDEIMGGWVPAGTGAASPASTIAAIKAYIDTRRTNVLAEIPQVYSLVTTVGGTTTAEGYLRTNDGSATFSGVFNVAKTYSITVNGVAATLSYRTPAGTWTLAVPAGGGTVLHPGLNRVNVKFWSGINGTGTAVDTKTVDVLFQPLTATYTNVSGTLAAGSLRITAPANFIPGKPFLVRADVLDAAGNVDRSMWDGTVALSTATAGITLPSIQLYNGTGSALVTAGGGGGGAPTVFFSYGTGGTGVANSGTPGSSWKCKTDFTSTTLASFITSSGATWKNEGFDDSTWVSRTTQVGFGDNDENTPVTNVDYDTVTAGLQSGPAYLFRNTFTIADVNAVSSVTGEVKYDDGAIVWVNGTLLLRTTNLDPGGSLTSYANFNGALSTENAIAALNIPMNLLHNGVNTIAVEVHQQANSSSDMTFDVKLQANYPTSDPGNFTMTGTYTGPTATFVGTKALTSLTTAPTITTVTGTLAAGTTTWSGVIQATGDVTVPTGSTLNISAGTTILMNGDATPGSTSGTRLVVNGTLNSNGTFAAPVTISATNGTDRFGGLVFSAAQPSTLTYTLINHAGHTTGVGHTGRGPALRLTGSSVSFIDSVLADNPGKAVYTSGTCSLTLTRALLERMITGPEVEDGCTVACTNTNIQRILPDYRESNAPLADDEDCFYVHNGGGASIVMNGCVFARCGDDVFDCLGGPITVTNCILREGWDKGMSLLNNDLTISGTQIIHCDKAIAHKSQNADTRTVTATNCTIISENHDSALAPWGYTGGVASGDPDTVSTGFYTQNKAGQSNTGATLVFNAKNCIIQAQAPVLIDTPYSAANTTLTYSNTTLLDNSTFTWAGTGNISANPLYANAASSNFRLTSTSPCRDTGDPAMTDPDLSRVDMGALYFGGGTAGGGTIAWTAAGGPYRLTAATTIPAGTTLTIGPGTAIYADQNVRMTVNGRILAQGTADHRITMSHVPGTVAAGDCDPIKNGTQTGPPKWGGLRIVDSLAQENIVQCVDFINAQGTSPATAVETDQENWGSVGTIRSWAWIDNCTWTGSHLRWCYGRCAKLTVSRCVFGDMFDATEAPPADFVTGSDNRQEPLKVEYVTTDTALSGNANFLNGFPVGGWFRVYYNNINGNKGHNDVFDGDGGRVGFSFPLDCRYNTFNGLTGDEHVDLKGDALIANNTFQRGTKDIYTIDKGYSNIVSGDAYSFTEPGGATNPYTTIMFARNLAFDVDHIVNCKDKVATIVEHNTIADMHGDFYYNSGGITQFVYGSVVNLIVIDDSGGSPAYGFGCYIGNNVISGVPRLVNGADTTQVIGHGVTSKLEFNNNLVDNTILTVAGFVGTTPNAASTMDTSIGFNHPGTIFASAYGTNTAGQPAFTNRAAKDYSLKSESPARRMGPVDTDLGSAIPEWAYIAGGPVGSTSATTASFTVGGPGLIAYKWRLDGGAWSAPVTIGTGGVFDRVNPVVRTGTVALTGLTAGNHTVEVLGQDFAGNWQDADPAKTYMGLPQFAPSARTWAVDAAFIMVRLNEVLADSATLADTIELHNYGTTPVTLTGWSLTDDALVPAKFPLPTTTIPAGGFATFSSALLALDPDGETAYLYQGATLRDSIAFGHQLPDMTIGRTGQDGAWSLCTPTLGAANVRAVTADLSGIRISEWFSSGDARYADDWLELSNSQAIPVNLAGLRITDNRLGNPTAHIVPALSFIAASGYVKLIADGNGGNHMPFTLDSQQDDITLFNTNGALLDTVQFYTQTTDYSQGRDAGGIGGLSQYELPTAGLANTTTDANALALLRGLRVTEIMYNALGGSEFDYVELTNVGATALQLQGVRFVSGLTFVFTVPTTLNAGERILVVKNLTKFRSRYGNTPVVAGVFTGTLSDGGEGVAIQLPPPFDANILTFNYDDNWYVSTDGAGTALRTISAATTAAGLWGDKDTWTASALGGSPGGVATRTDTFSGWMTLNGVNAVTDDNDHDGIPALIENALGMNPNSGNGTHGVAGAPVATSGSSYTFLVPVNAGAAQGHGVTDLVYNVQSSPNLATGPWASIAAKSFTTNWSGTVSVGAPVSGFIPVTVTDPAGGAQRFFRLQVLWVP